MFSNTLIERWSSAAYSTDVVRDLLTAACGGDHPAGGELRRVGAAARARGETPPVELALMLFAELPWSTLRVESGPTAPPPLFALGWSESRPGVDALLNVAVFDVKTILKLTGRVDADTARDAVLALETGDGPALERLSAQLATTDRRRRQEFSLHSHGDARDRMSDLLRSGLTTLDDELDFMSYVGSFAAATHARRVARKEGVDVGPEPNQADPYRHSEEHRVVLELVFQLRPDTVWDRLATYLESSWWNSKLRIQRLVGAIPWEEELHVILETDAWHGKRSKNVVLVVSGARNKKGSSYMKVHKTVAAAEKDLRARADAAGAKLGVTPAARPSPPPNAGAMLIRGASSADRYVVETMLLTGIHPDAEVDEDGQTALHVLRGADPVLTQMLLDAGADPRRTAGTSMNVLDCTARSNSFDGVRSTRLLVDLGVTFGEPKDTLYYAISNGRIDMVKMLLEQGAVLTPKLMTSGYEVGMKLFLQAQAQQ